MKAKAGQYWRVIGGGILACCLETASPAQSAEANWLRWSGPEECQNTEEVERQVQSLLGRGVDFDSLPKTHVVVSWDKLRQWELQVRVQLSAGVRQRQVFARTCSDGFDVVALTLALLLDERQPLAEADDEANRPEIDTTPALEAFAEQNKAPGDDASNGIASDGNAMDVQPTNSPPDANALARQEAPWPLTLGAALRTDVGTLPRILYGGGVQVGIRGSGWRSDLGAEFLVSSEDGLPSAVAPVQYSLAAASLQTCRYFSISSSTGYSNCLGLQGGSLAIAERGGDNRRTTAIWTSAQIGAELGVYVRPNWYNFARLQLVFPLFRHELWLEGGGNVHTLPSVSLQIQLGLAFDVTDSHN